MLVVFVILEPLTLTNPHSESKTLSPSPVLSATTQSGTMALLGPQSVCRCKLPLHPLFCPLSASPLAQLQTVWGLPGAGCRDAEASIQEALLDHFSSLVLEKVTAVGGSRQAAAGECVGHTALLGAGEGDSSGARIEVRSVDLDVPGCQIQLCRMREVSAT